MVYQYTSAGKKQKRRKSFLSPFPDISEGKTPGSGKIFMPALLLVSLKIPARTILHRKEKRKG